jgi:asparagine synthase (glutamine-hydrolysing)
VLRDARNNNPLARGLLRDLFESSLPALVRYADRSSMAHSREVRLPFLDRRVAEFVLSLPPNLLYRPGRPKWILRVAARGAVPDSILDRRDKIGFETPQEHWFADAGFRQRTAEILLDPAARARGLYDTGAIERDLQSGRWRSTDALWRALNAELWMRELLERR